MQDNEHDEDDEDEDQEAMNGSDDDVSPFSRYRVANFSIDLSPFRINSQQMVMWMEIITPVTRIVRHSCCWCRFCFVFLFCSAFFVLSPRYFERNGRSEENKKDWRKHFCFTLKYNIQFPGLFSDGSQRNIERFIRHWEYLFLYKGLKGRKRSGLLVFELVGKVALRQISKNDQCLSVRFEQIICSAKVEVSHAYWKDSLLDASCWKPRYLVHRRLCLEPTFRTSSFLDVYPERLNQNVRSVTMHSSKYQPRRFSVQTSLLVSGRPAMVGLVRKSRKLRQLLLQPFEQ